MERIRIIVRLNTLHQVREYSLMSRKKANSFITPRWLYFIVVLKVTAILMVIIWLTGRATPLSTSMRYVLIPFLGWVALALIAWVILQQVAKK